MADTYNTVVLVVEPDHDVLCPTCDRPLVYTHSYVGGVTAQQREQWDRDVCPDVCGGFEYRHRTRHVRHLA